MTEWIMLQQELRYYPILSYCIAGHHAGLPDYGNTAISSSLCGRWKKRICDYQAYKDEIRIPELDTEPIAFDKDRNMDFALGTFIRMLYSCLVDADFLDTELFMKNGDTGRNSGESMEILQNRLKNHISEWLKNTDEDTINGRRTEILNNCIREGKQKEGIFIYGQNRTIETTKAILYNKSVHFLTLFQYLPFPVPPGASGFQAAGSGFFQGGNQNL